MDLHINEQKIKSLFSLYVGILEDVLKERKAKKLFFFLR